MTTGKVLRNTLLTCGAALLSVINFSAALSAPLAIRDEPLFLNASAAPLNMLVVSRDHRLYYEAYNDASDLDGDGKIDTGYKPLEIDYYGYFDSLRCYTYNAGTERFVPTSATTKESGKTCAGISEWSGDWLNYMTMSRIDALRKVLYGGLRSTDTDSDTVLQRAHVPQDAHSWGKEYTSTALDGYDIAQYTPLSQPSSGHRHLFANTTLSGDPAVSGATNGAVNGVPAPRFRVLKNRRNNRIWEWVSKEQPVAGSRIDNSKHDDTAGSPRCSTNDLLSRGFNSGGTNCARDGDTQHGAGSLDDYTVRVQVCVAVGGSYESNCRTYPEGSVKPTGLLQDYGEKDTMLFGLLSGSYGKPHDGGVLRKAVASIKDEIDLDTGIFVYGAAAPGIITTLDRLRVTDFDGSRYGCGWITGSADSTGDCSMWGNPTAEMMYEAMRYFAGKTGSTGAFNSGANNWEETGLGLGVAPWGANTNPYRAGGYPTCAKPFQTVISDITPSFDSDQIPGSPFGGIAGDLDGLNATTLGDKIWTNEIGGSKRIFIGEVDGSAAEVSAPTAKSAGSFATIRGLAPEAPGRQGGYHAASVAYYGNTTDVNDAKGEQKVQTFAVALASPLPSIEIPVGTSKVTLVPFARSVGPAGGSYPINATGTYQPTNQIVDFYVENLTDTSGTFRINFEDVEQGADHDMDAIATYDYEVVNGQVRIKVTSEYAAGGIIQHMGYVITGTTADGTYLVVRDRDTPCPVSGGSCSGTRDINYFLDYPSHPVDALPFESELTFTPGGTAGGATFLKDPLWYAAKWGGFTEVKETANKLPDQRSEWAANADTDDEHPDPDNYFLVTNALKLKEQLAKAFDSILDRQGTASSASVSSGSISTDTRVFQAQFDSRDWSGHLLSFEIGTGSSGSTEGAIGALQWDAAKEMPAHDDRKIIVAEAQPNDAGVYDTAVPFRWNSLSDTLKQELDPDGDPDSDATTLGDERLAWLRGDRSNEATGERFRERGEYVLGDIVNSAPIFVGPPSYRYPDSIAPTAYSSFVSAKQGRAKTVYVGANDGMLHAFDAESGEERWAFVPRSVVPRLHRLTDPQYTHQYYVDGTPAVVDAYFSADKNWHSVLVAGLNKGGQGVYALDVTDPVLTEANAGELFMWEFTDARHADLGYSYSRPAVVKLPSGKWAAIFGNGYNNTESDGHVSSTGHAVLFVVDLETGTLIEDISTGVGDTTTPNGLSTPAVADLNGDGVADVAYAGDLRGNLWKFNLSDWSVQAIFKAVNADGVAQPITSRPQVGRGPQGRGVVVLFGTGKFLESADRNLATLTTQSFYGIYDNGTAVSGRSELVQQRIIGQTTATLNGAPVKARITSEEPVDPTSKKGWFLDLVFPATGFEGEMQVTDPVLRNGRIIFTTLIPDPDPCAFGGRSWLMDLNALTGARLETSPFDFNGDKIFSTDDLLPAGSDADGDGKPDPVAASGFSMDQIGSRPGIVGGSATGSGGDFAITTLSGGDRRSDRIDAGPGAIGRQSWRQLR